MIEKDELVSIIIPCYNSGKYIKETINSVKLQTYHNIEVILVNDGSTDNTSDILNEIVKENREYKLLEQLNEGLPAARNKGFQYSKGKYLLFLDSDDKISPTYIEKAVKIFHQNPDVGIVTCRAIFFGKYNKEWKLPKFKMPDYLLENCIFATSLVRREDFIKVGGFDTELTFFEDWDFFISIIKLGRVVYKIPEILFYYRRRDDETSMTDNSNTNIRSDNMLKIYIKHYNFYKENYLGIDILLSNNKYKKKYYNIWYRKYFYKMFSSKKYKRIYRNL